MFVGPLLRMPVDFPVWTDLLMNKLCGKTSEGRNNVKTLIYSEQNSYNIYSDVSALPLEELSYFCKNGAKSYTASQSVAKLPFLFETFPS